MSFLQGVVKSRIVIEIVFAFDPRVNTGIVRGFNAILITAQNGVQFFAIDEESAIEIRIDENVFVDGILDKSERRGDMGLDEFDDLPFDDFENTDVENPRNFQFARVEHFDVNFAKDPLVFETENHGETVVECVFHFASAVHNVFFRQAHRDFAFVFEFDASCGWIIDLFDDVFGIIWHALEFFHKLVIFFG